MIDIRQLAGMILLGRSVCIARRVHSSYGMSIRNTVSLTKLLHEASLSDSKDIKKVVNYNADFKSKCLSELMSRGYIYQHTNINQLDELLVNYEKQCTIHPNAKSPVKAYIGFDATAKALHVGSLIQLMFLRILRRHNHSVVGLLGGGTTKIGRSSVYIYANITTHLRHAVQGIPRGRTVPDRSSRTKSSAATARA